MGLHQEIKRDLVREEAKRIFALWDKLTQELASLNKAHTESTRKYTELGESLSNIIDRVAALEQSNENTLKECKKLHEKCTDLEKPKPKKSSRDTFVEDTLSNQKTLSG